MLTLYRGRQLEEDQAAAIVQAQMLASGRRGPDEAELRWLRDLRNRLLHEDRKGPVITVEQQWTARPEWETQARRAVRVIFAVMYAETGKDG